MMALVRKTIPNLLAMAGMILIWVAASIDEETAQIIAETTIKTIKDFDKPTKEALEKALRDG